MKLVVFSHKLVWRNQDSPTGYSTDGGFAFQMGAISKIFDQTTIVVPVLLKKMTAGEVHIQGQNLKIVPLENISGHGLRRKINYLFWFIKNVSKFNTLINEADAVHTPIPSDIGTLGMILALIKKKPLLVRYCGNWLVQNTIAEKCWKWLMEKFAGGKNVMLATGLQSEKPSEKNPNIKWIFSSSLTESELNELREKPPKLNINAPRLIIVCRMEEGKGVEQVISAVNLIKDEYPSIRLDVVGDGGELKVFKDIVSKLNLKSHVVFHGKLNHQGVLAALKDAQVFCYPTSFEGFPKVVLEALASGLPVFATAVSAIPELLKPGGGMILRNNEPETLLQELRELFLSPERYPEMQAYAFETASAFSLEKWGDSIKLHLQKAWNL